MPSILTYGVVETIAPTDHVVIVKDPGGTPAVKRVTVANALAGFGYGELVVKGGTSNPLNDAFLVSPNPASFLLIDFDIAGGGVGLSYRTTPALAASNIEVGDDGIWKVVAKVSIVCGTGAATPISVHFAVFKSGTKIDNSEDAITILNGQTTTFHARCFVQANETDYFDFRIKPLNPSQLALAVSGASLQTERVG